MAPGFSHRIVFESEFVAERRGKLIQGLAAMRIDLSRNGGSFEA